MPEDGSPFDPTNDAIEFVHETFMKRTCNCSGGNCGAPADGLSRREFIGFVGAGTAGALLANSALGAFDLPADELERWKRTLRGPGPARRYFSDTHTDARLHLGGIGTGNFELGADGQFATWQLFNTLRDGQVPLHFAVRCGGVTRLLQTTGGPDWPRVPRIEMRGEYPFAFLEFRDPELPVRIELSAFTPFAPLDAATSSIPAAFLSFHLTNPTDQPVEVSLAAFTQNVVGYDAAGAIAGVNHPSFGGNVTEPFTEPYARGLFFRANAGQEASLDQPVVLYATPNLRALNSPPPDRPEPLKLEVVERALPSADRLAAPARTIIWFEEAAADFAENWLRIAREAVQAGATLVFSGRTLPLLRTYAAATGGQPLGERSVRPDVLFQDFERGYGDWKAEGAAFGKAPARGTLPNQQRVSGFAGQALVNTYLEGDDTTGTLTSPPFTIERHFIRFLVGGGSPRHTQMRLVMGGKTVRTISGKDNERLEPAMWDVQEFAGQTAHLEIVDDQQGPWGHINIDHIVFSDEPGNRAVLALLDELLPARFSAIHEGTAQPGGLRAVEFENLQLKADAKPARARNGLDLFTRALGKGQVVLVGGQVLDPAQAAFSPPRQQAYALLCDLIGARYQPGEGQHPKAPGFGTMALGVSNGTHSALAGFTDWSAAWKQFSETGRFESFDKLSATAPSSAGHSPLGALATTMTMSAKSATTFHFILTWHYPNKYNAAGTWMGCHYATRWPDARAVLRDVTETKRFSSLLSLTDRFRSALYDSTLPYWLLDCVTANAAIIRHIGVTFRIANGDVYGWEGSNGCCQPTCTHVWGYEQTLARLFPELEREMRRIDYQHQQREDGGINNRTNVPSPLRPTGEQPFADGHASCVLKAYREALNAPDERFFQEYWPPVKRAVEYLIGRDAKTHGGAPAGYLEDDQWNTYDQILHGVTTFISGYYLAALRAGEEWARRVNDEATADRFRGVFEQGRQQLVERCWNGEYFEQRLADYLTKPGTVGPGCMSDQLIGQWWAHQLGLGYLLPQDNIVAALKAVYTYNFKTDLTGWRHAPRAFAGAKDKGLLIVTWPKGGRPPHVMLYSDEVWTGIEYQVAAHMIYEGLIEEGLAIAKAARDRYDGVPRPPIPRNPWNEIECGGHYARAMSSYSLLLALSGFAHDGPRGIVRFGPRLTPGNFKSFWCGAEGWGSIAQSTNARTQRVELAVTEGKLRATLLDVAVAPGLTPTKTQVTIGARAVPSRLIVRDGRAEIRLDPAAEMTSGRTLTDRKSVV